MSRGVWLSFHNHIKPLVQETNGVELKIISTERFPKLV